jgi:hypothetical protein
MATTVAQMTKDELVEVIETVVEQKLLELLGDPDEGLPIRKSVRERRNGPRFLDRGQVESSPLRWYSSGRFGQARNACISLIGAEPIEGWLGEDAGCPGTRTRKRCYAGPRPRSRTLSGLPVRQTGTPPRTRDSAKDARQRRYRATGPCRPC